MRPINYLLYSLCLAALLAGCGLFGGKYEETFDAGRAWGVQRSDEVQGAVADGRFVLTMLLPDSIFWSTAGRRGMDSGAFSVDVEPLDGSNEAAYGLVFRASGDVREFYFFMISRDGYYSIGRCQDNCTGPRAVTWLTPQPWVASDILANSPTESHNLRVVADGRRLSFAIDGQPLATYDDSVLTIGDIGFIMQTFDSAATVAFDNLTYAPTER